MNDTRWLSLAALTAWALVTYGTVGYSGEHGGQEHGGSSLGSTSSSTSTSSTAKPSKPVPDRKSKSTKAKPAKPSKTKKATPKDRTSGALPAPAESIRGHIAQHVEQRLASDGTFVMEDQETGTSRRLQFVQVHERVGKTGGFYYSCADLRDVTTGELLDLDFDVMATGDQLEVVDARIHKVDGKARYTYDSDDTRIPIPPSQR